MPRSIFFHEDDFCQIELLPVENLVFCLKQAGVIEDFAQSHQGGFGFTDAFMREECHVKLSQKDLPATALHNLLTPRFPPYDEVRTGYGSHDVVCKSTFAYGQNERVVLFSDSEGDILQNMWLTLDLSSSDELARAKELFQMLGSFTSLLIADWGLGIIAPLIDTEQINPYLEKRLGVF